MAKKPTSKSTKTTEITESGTDIDQVQDTKVVSDEPEFVPVEEAVVEQDEVQVAPKKSNKPKLMAGGALLVVGAVGALFLGPKIAPSLPAGMAPVAQFLSPGSADAVDQIEALSQQMNTRLMALENQPAPQMDGKYLQAVDALSQEFTLLSDQVAAGDSGDIEARLSQVETKLAGLTAWVEQTDERLLSGDGSTDASASLAIIESLRAELAALAAKQGQFDQQIDQVKVATQRRVDEAESKVVDVIETTSKTIDDAQTAKAKSDILAAIESGANFEEPLNVLGSSGIVLPAALVNAAANGVPTLSTLKEEFSPVAHAALKADIKDASASGLTSKLAGLLKSQVTVRSLEPKEGDDVDAVLSRMQGALDRDDLAGALSEAQGLSEASKGAMNVWLLSANQHNDVVLAFDALTVN